MMLCLNTDRPAHRRPHLTPNQPDNSTKAVCSGDTYMSIVAAVVVVLPRAVCCCIMVLVVVLLVLIYKARVVSIQIVCIPGVVIVSLLPLGDVPRVSGVMGVMVLVVVVVVYMGGLGGVWGVGGLGRGRNRHVVLLLMALLVLYRCRGMHRHGCSVLRGCGGWCVRCGCGCGGGNRFGGARGGLLLLGLCVCWWQVVQEGVVLLNLSLNVLRVGMLLVLGVVSDLDMGSQQLGTQTAGGGVEGRRRTKTTQACKQGLSAGTYAYVQPLGSDLWECCSTNNMVCMKHLGWYPIHSWADDHAPAQYQKHPSLSSSCKLGGTAHQK